MNHLVLLHGALASREQMEPLAVLLEPHFTVHVLNLDGHGGIPIPSDGYSFDHFAERVNNYLDDHSISSAHGFGYSMGGYALLYSAFLNPMRWKSLATLGTKFEWDASSTERELRLLDPEKMEAKIPAFVEKVRQIHAPVEWKEVVRATRSLLMGLGEKPLLDAEKLKTISQRTLIMVGDTDATAGVEESRKAASQLPSSQFKVLHQLPHAFEAIDKPMLADELKQFFG